MGSEHSGGLDSRADLDNVRRHDKRRRWGKKYKVIEQEVKENHAAKYAPYGQVFCQVTDGPF